VNRHATAVVCACVVATLCVACDAQTRHRTLTRLFDGVPPVKTAPPAPPKSSAGPAEAPPSRHVGYAEHGPYAAKLCSACHNAAATNALVLPADQLCFQCHDLALNKRYVHGPLASGGCLLCHDPHSSKYGFLLVSDSDSFCFRCHDRASVERIEGHAEAVANCTNCHDAHGSDTKYLLK
jgi:predicted CXXCH cytochrome family protein